VLNEIPYINILNKARHVVPALGRLGQEDGELEASLGYMARHFVKKKKKRKKPR
jgi:hypothetical protein